MKFYQVATYTVTLVTSINTYAAPKLDVIEDSCDNIMQYYDLDTEYFRQNYPHCFVSKSGPYVPNTINVVLFGQVQAISNVISNRFLPSNKPPATTTAKATSGMSSGSEFTKWNFWGTLTSNETEQSLATKTKLIDIDTTIGTGLLGGDYTLSPTMVVGLSASINRGNGSIDHLNDAGLLISENNDSNSFVIAPYFGMQLSPELSLDVSLGFGSGELDLYKNTKNDYDSWFTGVNLSYATWMDNIQLSSKLSYMHGEEDHDASKTNGKTNPDAATNKLDQIRLGTQVGYWLDGFMPYVSLAYSSDVSSETSRTSSSFVNSIGKNAWIWGLGVDFFSLPNDITGGLSFTKEEGRDHQDNNTIAGNISIKF